MALPYGQDIREYVQGDPSGGKPGLGFGMFHHPAWAVGSYSSGHQPGELPKSKSTQPRFATRCITLPVQGNYTYRVGLVVWQWVGLT